MVYLCQNRIGTSSSSGKEGDAHVNCSGENWKQTGTSKGTKKYEKSSDDRKEAIRKHRSIRKGFGSKPKGFGSIRKSSGRFRSDRQDSSCPTPRFGSCFSTARMSRFPRLRRDTKKVPGLVIRPGTW